jgi:hypothetical protein
MLTHATVTTLGQCLIFQTTFSKNETGAPRLSAVMPVNTSGGIQGRKVWRTVISGLRA